jgi:hypothetical protein
MGDAAAPYYSAGATTFRAKQRSSTSSGETETRAVTARAERVIHRTTVPDLDGDTGDLIVFYFLKCPG